MSILNEQGAFIASVFNFIETTDGVNVRRFCQAAGISTATLYRAKARGCFAQIDSAIACESAMRWLTPEKQQSFSNSV